MASGVMKCAKYTLLVFNIVYFVAGIALIVIGSLIATMFNEYFAFFSGKVNSAAIFLIVIGVVIFVVSFFGCCGAFRESYGMTVTYMVLLGLIVVLELGAFIAFYVNRVEIQEKLAERMERTIPDYNKTEVTKSWNVIQENLKCCGAISYMDWKKNGILNVTHSVPDSCCLEISNDCGQGATSDGGKKVNHEGCAPRLTEILEQKIALIAGLAAALIVIKLVGLLLAALLAYGIRQEYQSI